MGRLSGPFQRDLVTLGGSAEIGPFQDGREPSHATASIAVHNTADDGRNRLGVVLPGLLLMEREDASLVPVLFPAIQPACL
jgi:hypothetical protein